MVIAVRSHLGPLFNDAKLVVHPEPLEQRLPDARLDANLILPPDLGIALLSVHRILESQPPGHEVEDDQIECSLGEEVRGYRHVASIFGTAPQRLLGEAVNRDVGERGCENGLGGGRVWRS